MHSKTLFALTDKLYSKELRQALHHLRASSDVYGGIMASYKNFKSENFKYHKVGDLYQIDTEFRMSLEDDNYRYVFTIYPGFRTDGGSIPFLFRWFAKPWDSENLSYSACFILHDACYASACVHRDIADDMLRSALRDTGVDRLHASTICWCVNNFAKGHYGPENDDQDNYDFVKFEMYHT